MALRIQNSLTKQKELFEPLEPGRVRMYACGPTVYDEPHIGHLRSAYVFDVIRNYLKYGGYNVTFVRNVTDVDDKIIEKAREASTKDLNAEVSSVAVRYHRIYLEHLDRLGIASPDVEPTATRHIGEMIALIEKLIQSGRAYASAGDVYFEVGKFPGYGKLSHQNTEAMMESARLDPNDKKHNPLDFALWKKSAADEPSWPSPWGAGRPGWHIECSAMSMKYLGESFDIHGGGRDLIFPHHENEIAQSESATGKPFAKYWMHHGLITIEKQKMSKSLKNYVTLDSVSATGSHAVEELKLLFLGTHYGAPLDYSEERMKAERSVWKRFYYFFEETAQIVEASPDAAFSDRHEAAFRAAMDDDFNTPEVLAVFHGLMHEARKSSDPAMLSAAAKLLRKWGDVFGLFKQIDRVLQESKSVDGRMQEAIRRRTKAKETKDFKTADAIRDELSKQGVMLTDLKGGKTVWRRLE